MKRNLLLIVPVLAAISLSACAGQPTSKPRVKASPSSDFLYASASEFGEGKNGPMCEEITKDWIAQNLNEVK